MTNTDNQLSLFRPINTGESLVDSDLDKSRVVLANCLKDAEPIAVVSMFQNHYLPVLPVALLDVLQNMKVLRGKQGFFHETPIDNVALYLPKDVRDALKCNQDECQIIRVGKYDTNDLMPMITFPDGSKDLDKYVSRVHCAISYNPFTNHIQISDVGTEQRGSKNSTLLRGEKLVCTTKPWEEGSEAGIGGLVSRHPKLCRVGLRYALTDYGRSQGINQEQAPSSSERDLSLSLH